MSDRKSISKNNSNSNSRIIVIGAGASGMLAAGTAGSRGAEVVLLEKNDRPGRKLMITGKGRCNITNNTDMEGLMAGVPVNGKFLYSAFNRFSAGSIINLFHELGLETKTERGGRVFPVSDKAAEVVDTLIKYLRINNVKLIKGEAAGITTAAGAVTGVLLKNKEFLPAHKVIISTGGMSYPLTGSTGDGYRFARQSGHTVIPLHPSLVPLEIHENLVADLQGLSLKNAGFTVLKGDGEKTGQKKKEKTGEKLGEKKGEKTGEIIGEIIYKDFGELLFTHFGVSGPVVLSASTYMHDPEKNKYKIIIDLKPALSVEQLDKRVQRDFAAFSRKIFANSLHELLPRKLIPVIISLSGIPADKQVNQISKKEREQLVLLLKNLQFNVKKFRPTEEAIITAGGVSTQEINPRTMESLLVRGLFFTGEVIDVNAYTGGYNLQIAFSTGYVAGAAAAGSGDTTG